MNSPISLTCAIILKDHSYHITECSAAWCDSRLSFPSKNDIEVSQTFADRPTAAAALAIKNFIIMAKEKGIRSAVIFLTGKNEQPSLLPMDIQTGSLKLHIESYKSIVLSDRTELLRKEAEGIMDN